MSARSPLVTASRTLARAVDKLSFAGAAAYVYNPLVYAGALAESYLEKYGGAPKNVLLLGMNPGPFGMAQTGVPFGDVGMVRTWLGLDGVVGKPPREHPKRPVEGLACTRHEVSGSRLWGWARDRFGTPQRFFAGFFVANYCPLVFMDDGGRNLTPDKLPANLTRALFTACDEALRAFVAHLKPTHVIGVGAFAQGRARDALANVAGVSIGTILHPSPASPAANRGWAAVAERQLEAQGVSLPARR